jgi:hypothetical protein
MVELRKGDVITAQTADGCVFEMVGSDGEPVSTPKLT